MPFLPPNQQRQSSEGTALKVLYTWQYKQKLHKTAKSGQKKQI